MELNIGVNIFQFTFFEIPKEQGFLAFANVLKKILLSSFVCLYICFSLSGSTGDFLFSLRPEVDIYRPSGLNTNYFYLNTGQETFPNGVVSEHCDSGIVIMLVLVLVLLLELEREHDDVSTSMGTSTSSSASTS